MTALVSVDAKPAIGHTATDTGAITLGARLSRFLAAWRKAARQRRLHAELAGMSDAMLLDIGVAEDEIFLIRQGGHLTPRAWVARNPVSRHLAI